MRLIDADVLLGYVNKYDTGQPIGKALRAMLEKSPTVDAVPVIRCKECKYWERSISDVTKNRCTWTAYIKEPEGFCDWAERRQE